MLAYSASDSAPIFFFALPKKKTVARRRKLCIARFHGGVKTDSRRCVSFPPHKRCAGLCGGFWASSKGLCAFPDAQPLTLAVVVAWQSHCLFDVMRQDVEEDQACGICQPWGIKGGRARPSFVVSKSGFSGGRNRNLPPERLFGFFLAAQKETRIRRCGISSVILH